ncbi:hypothetical protein P3L10_001007 [Capsicum annuum]
MGKVHGSLARAGKVRGQTPKVAKQDKKKKPRGRAHKRMQYNRRFVTAGKFMFAAINEEYMYTVVVVVLLIYSTYKLKIVVSIPSICICKCIWIRFHPFQDYRKLKGIFEWLTNCRHICNDAEPSIIIIDAEHKFVFNIY